MFPFEAAVRGTRAAGRLTGGPSRALACARAVVLRTAAPVLALALAIVGIAPAVHSRELFASARIQLPAGVLSATPVGNSDVIVLGEFTSAFNVQGLSFTPYLAYAQTEYFLIDMDRDGHVQWGAHFANPNPVKVFPRVGVFNGHVRVACETMGVNDHFTVAPGVTRDFTDYSQIVVLDYSTQGQFVSATGTARHAVAWNGEWPNAHVVDFCSNASGLRMMLRFSNGGTVYGPDTIVCVTNQLFLPPAHLASSGEPVAWVDLAAPASTPHVLPSLPDIGYVLRCYLDEIGRAHV